MIIIQMCIDCLKNILLKRNDGSESKRFYLEGNIFIEC